MKNFIIIIFLIFNSIQVFSCTTFVIKDSDNLIFGRNLDWVSDNGVVVVNKRNVQKTSLVFPPERPTSWTSKYGSITFNQFGKEFPFGGINEKGLVIEIMLVPGEYPGFDDRTALNELQWIQYQLDNSVTIDDVINTDKIIRISKIDQNLHFLICDSSGNIAVIEFDKDKMIVYRGDDLPVPVLENDTYSMSMAKHKEQVDCRFLTASNMINDYKPDNNQSVVDYSFTILDKVALDGSWSIVYDIKKMEIHFKTASNKVIRKISFKEFDFDCKSESLLYDLARKDNETVNHLFVTYNYELNKRKLDAAIRSNKIKLPKEVLNEFYRYSGKCKCTAI